MAAASGLHLVHYAQRDPRITTSYGTGELILAALERGVKAIIIGIGGSATNDGGAGMMQALGARFLDGEGCELAPAVQRWPGWNGLISRHSTRASRRSA